MARMNQEQRKLRTTKRLAVSAFVIGAAVSVAANMIAAEPTALGRVVSAWPAVALLLTIHLFQNARRSLAVQMAIAAVAGVAAWVSYWHMVEVALMAGETTITAHLLPITVDAMMYVATVVHGTKPKPTRRPVRRQKAQVKPLRSVS